MLTRRRFVGSLAGLTALTALAGAGLRPPKRADVDVSQYLADPNGWRLEGWNYSNNLATATELSEKVLEDMLRELSLHGHAWIRIQPNKLIVPPQLLERAEYIMTHRPSLFRRAMWWLFPEPA
jgi:hypothetical protein